MIATPILGAGVIVSWWLLIGMLGMMVVILLLSYKLFASRKAIVSSQETIVENRVKERTDKVEGQNAVLIEEKANLKEELDRDEELLLNMLPRNVAKEIIETGKAAPKNIGWLPLCLPIFKISLK